LRNRQTALISLAFARRVKPDSPAEPGRTVLSPRRNLKILLRATLILVAIISLGFNSLAQEQPSEYEVKAAFLFNFAKFIDWPPEVFADTNSPIVVGVLGKNVFGNNLEKTIRDRKVNNRGFQFRNYTSITEVTNCQILFISPSEKADFPKIVGALHNASVLTVSETDGFIQAGGMINFMIQDNKIRFQISDEAAKKGRLKISSKLLSLAVPAK
jgi:YfiR/HmsC-like